MENREVIFPSMELPVDGAKSSPDAGDSAKTAGKPKAPSWLLENINTLTKSARALLPVYVGILLYCALTILGTSDRQIIFDEQARLPIADLHVSFRGFVITAPLIAIVVFIYFQLHLNALARGVNQLKQNYAPVEKGKLYPWVLNIYEDSETGALGVIQRSLFKLALWWLLPIVLFLYAFKTIKRHEVYLSSLVLAISFLGTLFIVYVWHRHDSSRELRSQDQGETKARRHGFSWGQHALVYITFVLYLFLIYLTYYAGHTENRYSSFLADLSRLSGLELTNLAGVDLDNQVLVTEQKEEYGNYWLVMNNVHLENASLNGTILKRANLRTAHLQGATLYSTNFEEATLTEADFSEAMLLTTKFKKAHLGRAKFLRADLAGSDFQEASISLGNFENAQLTLTDFRKAYFENPNFKGAVLYGVKLTGAKGLLLEDISKAYSLKNSIIDEALLTDIATYYPHILFGDIARSIFLDIAPSYISEQEKANNEGERLFGERRWAEAEAQYRHAVSLSPKGSRYHFNLANALHAQQKIAEAEAEYREAVSLEPKEPIPHAFLGNSLSLQKRFAEAEKEYREAVRLKPEDPHYHYKLAASLQDQKKLKEAEAELREAVRLNPDDPVYHYLLALLLRDLRKDNEAETELKETEKLLPSSRSYLSYRSSEFHYQLANILLDRQRYAEAEKQYRKAVELDPGQPHYHYGLATALQAQKKQAEALTEYKEAARLSPGNAYYQKSLSEASKMRKK